MLGNAKDSHSMQGELHGIGRQMPLQWVYSMRLEPYQNAVLRCHSCRSTDIAET